MAATGLTIAEEVVDRQTISDRFQGEEYPLTTGRVRLHAVAAGDQVLCGRVFDDLLPVDQHWDPAYLPHLARCGECAAASNEPSADDGDEAGDLRPGRPASGVDIRALNGTEHERAGVHALRAILAQHDLRRWMNTDLVLVNEEIRGGVSHPLMISPDLLLRRPACALTTFLHEQVHWLHGPGFDAATTEARERWPDPPPLPAGGHDAESSWLHISVCALEYQSLSEILGPAAATAELGQHQIYSWMYEKILSDPGWSADFLRRHGLRIPEQPPVPRRYYGDDWWKDLVSRA
jgi:hypothetical protein